MPRSWLKNTHRESSGYKENLKTFYSMGTSNHSEHNKNPDYWDILISDLTSSPKSWSRKVFLDFGCGKGRNIVNAKNLCNWDKLIGVDISSENIEYCKNNLGYAGVEWYENEGGNVPLSDESVDFALSTIVLQHICHHDLRVQIKKEIYRVLKNGGVFSFQMGFDGKNPHSKNHAYHANFVAKDSNGQNDVGVEKEEQLTHDLEKVGFKNIEHKIKTSYSDDQHKHWIYTRCEK